MEDTQAERAPAAGILRTFEDESLSPRVIEFARFLADRLDSGSATIVPTGLVVCSSLSIYDLEQGVDGFTGKPIKNSLVGLGKPEYDELLRHVPHLARVAFPEEFAAEVQDFMVKNSLLPAPEATIAPTLEVGEIITEPVTNLAQAKEMIVEPAKQRLLALDWAKLGANVAEIPRWFDAGYPLTLRNAPYNLPLTVLLESRPSEKVYVDALPPSHKEPLGANFWLVQTEAEIDPETATTMRDHVFLKGVDIITGMNNLDPQVVFRTLEQDVDGPISRATTRIYSFMQNHPERMRPE